MTARNTIALTVLAVLVVTLEQRLGVDPFRDTTANARTLGDLVSVYNTALKV